MHVTNNSFKLLVSVGDLSHRASLDLREERPRAHGGKEKIICEAK